MHTRVHSLGLSLGFLDHFIRVSAHRECSPVSTEIEHERYFYGESEHDQLNVTVKRTRIAGFQNLQEF